MVGAVAEAGWVVLEGEAIHSAFLLGRRSSREGDLADHRPVHRLATAPIRRPWRVEPVELLHKFRPEQRASGFCAVVWILRSSSQCDLSVDSAASRESQS